MLKPASLRAHLSAAVPELTRDPERLIVFARDGHIATTGTASLSWEYAYTLQVLVLDFTGHADAIVAPTLAWLRRNQSNLFDHPAQRDQALRFEVEFLNQDSADLALEMDLTERVLVRPRAGSDPGALTLVHPPEPLPVSWIQQAERWRLFVQGEQVAEWSFDPRPLV